MKKIAFLMMAVFVLSGCAAWQTWTIPNDPNTQAIAYGAGKGVGVAVMRYAPKADAPLSTAWVEMMASNAGGDPIPAEKIQAFWQQAVMLLAQQTNDPYGLISDLTMLISIYGGFVDENGKLVLGKPVPLAVARAFELGYQSGKSAAKGYQK